MREVCEVAIGDRVRIYLGDCLELRDRLRRSGVGLVVSDPPYGIGYEGGGARGRRGAVRRGAEVRRNLEAIAGDERPFDPEPWTSFGTPVLLWGADHYARRLPESGRWLAWDKTGGRLGGWDSFADVEFAWASSPGASRIYRYTWKGLCQGAGEDKGTRRLVSTQKPVCVMRWSLQECSGRVRGTEVVLDPYMGSGTTGVAALRTGRSFVGVELLEERFRIAEKRLREEVRAGGR